MTTYGNTQKAYPFTQHSQKRFIYLETTETDIFRELKKFSETQEFFSTTDFPINFNRH